MCCWCYYWSLWCWGGALLCVVDMPAAGQGESEDRTSLRGVAVNLWPRWLSLQGGGSQGGGRGHLEVRLVQGHMMAGRGGGEVSNLVFVCEAFLPPPPPLSPNPSSENRVWEAGQCQREVTYFMSRLKGMVVSPQRGGREAAGADECHVTQSHVCLQGSALLFWPP